LRHLSGVPILGSLLASPTNNRLDWNCMSKAKNSSLCGSLVSYEEKSF
jgi:hypothetical protein